jgi:hypothetical protein
MRWGTGERPSEVHAFSYAACIAPIRAGSIPNLSKRQGMSRLPAERRGDVSFWHVTEVGPMTLWRPCGNMSRDIRWQCREANRLARKDRFYYWVERHPRGMRCLSRPGEAIAHQARK